MNLETVRIVLQSNDNRRDSVRIRAALDEIKELTSQGNKVLVHLDSSLGKDHISRARRYSKNVRDVEEQVKRVNGLLLITLLRSVKIPTHTETIDDEKRGATYLKRTKQAVACVY